MPTKEQLKSYSALELSDLRSLIDEVLSEKAADVEKEIAAKYSAILEAAGLTVSVVKKSGKKARKSTGAMTYKTYKNPSTGEIWVMKGPAKKPAWLLGSDGKVNEMYLVI